MTDFPPEFDLAYDNIRMEQDMLRTALAPLQNETTTVRGTNVTR
jgi:hypothetical protein